MNAIVCVDQNWGIGKNNNLLFHLSEDMRYFRAHTLDQFVICGRKTLESFPNQKPLPRRKHFVLTHAAIPETDDLTPVSSLKELFEKIAVLPTDSVWVIGGDSVYRQLISYCDKVFVTKVFDSSQEADAYFPNLDEDTRYRLIDPGTKLVSENGQAYAFQVYQNQNPISYQKKESH